MRVAFAKSRVAKSVFVFEVNGINFEPKEPYWSNSCIMIYYRSDTHTHTQPNTPAM